MLCWLWHVGLASGSPVGSPVLPRRVWRWIPDLGIEVETGEARVGCHNGCLSMCHPGWRQQEGKFLTSSALNGCLGHDFEGLLFIGGDSAVSCGGRKRRQKGSRGCVSFSGQIKEDHSISCGLSVISGTALLL